MNPQIFNPGVDILSNGIKLGIHLSGLSEENKAVANLGVDTAAISFKLINEKYEKELAEHKRKIYREAAVRYNLDKVVTFVDGQNRPYFRMYGGDIEGFAKACSVVLLGNTYDMNPHLAELERKYGIVLYERT